MIQLDMVFAQKPVGPGCVTCGAETKQFRSSGKFAKYCSEACTKPRKTGRRLGIHSPQKRPGLVKWRSGPGSVLLYCRYCKRCGQDMIGTAAQIGRKYCSAECRATISRMAFRERRRAREAEIATCQQCQKPFAQVQYLAERQRRVRRKFCSVECRLAAARAALRAWQAKRKPRVVQRQCKGCDATITEKHQQYCTVACRNADIRRKRKQLRARQCIGCEVWFSPLRYSEKGYNSRYCSLECQARASREIKKLQKNRAGHSSRARRKGGRIERVDPLIVFALHRWTCQICRVATPESLRGTNHPCEPTLDHRVPLAKGGDHTYANVQCACRDCNTRKAAGVDIFHEDGRIKDAAEGGSNGTS